MTEVAKQGAKLQQGATLVLTGKPNVGKSSLFNALCTQNRAIVTDIPGTTRDVVGMDINIQGVSLRLLDTAGIREQADAVEKEGIARAQLAMQSADCIIHVYDHELDHKRVNERVSELANIHDENTASRVDQRSIVVINKADLLDKDNHNEQSPVADDPLYISAKTGAGLDQLKQQIIKVLGLQSIDQQPPFSARLRHIEALNRASEAIDIALQHINSDTPLELSAEECRTAQQCLAEITGEFTPDDLLDYVFREFCIGK
jgi:tRNA modification GTPase